MFWNTARHDVAVWNRYSRSQLNLVASCCVTSPRSTMHSANSLHSLSEPLFLSYHYHTILLRVGVKEGGGGGWKWQKRGGGGVWISLSRAGVTNHINARDWSYCLYFSWIHYACAPCPRPGDWGPLGTTPGLCKVVKFNWTLEQVRKNKGFPLKTFTGRTRSRARIICHGMVSRVW